ncbi:SOS response-associated peptidase family protein [Erwinia sp. PK3-005]|uniref:Abasic site processing protein n=1 Tax=Mixta hanseatica TaxID=2872648 RepID=A0ABY4R5P1_9GAMM|nr:SOS response-associated peptidase family protein [Mixta hanseatica]UQY42707.1 SOS response-associated peptidase family protein [Mixta hanseatica]
MCGRFTQIQSREVWLSALEGQAERNIAWDEQPIGRYNVAPGSHVLLLNHRDDALHLDPVFWGYAPPWWHKAPLINARVETAAESKMFRPLWQHGRAVVMADGWYEWKREGDKKQPYYIYHRQRQPLFFAAIGHAPYARQQEKEGFVIITAASDRGMVALHDRRPLVLEASAVSEWLHPATSAQRASELVEQAALDPQQFSWHPVSRAVGNPHHQQPELVEAIADPLC